MQRSDTIVIDPGWHLRAAMRHRVGQVISAQIDSGIVRIEDGDQAQLVQAIPESGNAHEVLRAKRTTRDCKILDQVGKRSRAFHHRP
ncbi:MAG: hypothetical protein IPJ48_08505 [Propionivibrio sp.]|uniref:Uncharacterized protein n=1 Tax=Candidatus Propionivibrio dominans TaxID=2954373 RepID=A0A9D7I7B9_9RHOO|nr:hypothetical protein [Candidatus Propionivibrio dominans]